MPTLNKNFSDPSTEIGDYPVNISGTSPYIRWPGPMVARAGDHALSRQGRVWHFGRATAAIAMPATPADPASGVQAEFTACGYDAATGDVSAGATHRSFAPFAIGEHGWIEQI